MRVLFLFLLFGDVAFYAWSRYLAPPPTGTDARPLARQIRPEALHILTPAQVAVRTPVAPKPAATAAAVPAVPSSVPPSLATASAQAPSSAPPPLATASALACLQWGTFDPADAERAAQALAALGLGARLSQHSASAASNWWVFIPAQASLEAAQKKTSELKNLGVNDYFIVQDQGPDRWAVSLGVFRSEAAANARLDALRAKKVHSALAGPRVGATDKLWYQIQDVDSALHAKLGQLAQRFPGSELRVCPPTPASR